MGFAARSWGFPHPVTAARLLALGGTLIGLGMLAGRAPLIALAGAVGLTLTTTILVNLIAGVYLIAALSFAQIIPALSSGVTLAKAAGIVVFLGWLASIARSRGRTRPTALVSAQPMLVGALMAFLAWAVVSLTWVESSSAGASALLRFTLDILLIPISFAALTSARRVRTLVGILAVGAAASAAYGLVVAQGDSTRIGGAALNPNDLGALLVPAIAVLAGFAAGAVADAAVRIAAGALALFCLVALVLTATRGALFGLVGAAMVLPFVFRRSALAGALVGAGTVAALVIAVLLWAPAQTKQRIIHPGNGSGRQDLWLVAARMAEAHPLQGVGVGGFTTSSVHYLVEPGLIQRDEYILDNPKAPHNVYLEVLADLGVVGLALFAAILVAILASFLHAARCFDRARRPDLGLLTRVVFIGVIGFLITIGFESELFLKQLWLLLAVGPALLAISRNALSASGAHTGRLS